MAAMDRGGRRHIAHHGPTFQTDLFLSGCAEMKFHVIQTQTSHKSKPLDFFGCIWFSQQHTETESEFLHTCIVSLTIVKLYMCEGAGVGMSTVKLNTPLASRAGL